MRDIGFDKFLVGVIGVPGLTVCVMAWVQPMDISERILTTVIGTIGLIWALFRGLSMRSIPAKGEIRIEETEAEKSSVNKR